MRQTIRLFCPRCGQEFETTPNCKGKLGGLIVGGISGAWVLSKVGIAMGPVGAISGMVPGAILGAIFGNGFGNKFDETECPSRNLSFQIPTEMKEKYLANLVIDIVPITRNSRPKMKRFHESKTSIDYDSFFAILKDLRADETYKLSKTDIRVNKRSIKRGR
jgi:hypothetical protein